jgi:hypothetical protein
MARSDIDLTRIINWAEHRHDRLGGDENLCFIPPPASVRRLAVPMYKRYRKAMVEAVDDVGDSPLHPFSLCLGEDSFPIFEAACWLVHALELHGLCYQRIVEISNKQVADIVCSISSDLRENDTKRHEQLVGRMAKAPPEARIIKIAEIYEAVRMTAFKRIEPTLVDARRRSGWLKDRLEVIETAAMDELEDTPVGPFLVNLRKVIRGQLEPIRELIRSPLKKRQELVTTGPLANGIALPRPTFAKPVPGRSHRPPKSGRAG